MLYNVCFQLESKVQIQEYKLKKREEEELLRRFKYETENKPTQLSKLEQERIKERVSLSLVFSFCSPSVFRSLSFRPMLVQIHEVLNVKWATSTLLITLQRL